MWTAIHIAQMVINARISLHVQSKSASSRRWQYKAALFRLSPPEWTNEAVSTAINSPLPVLSRLQRPHNNTAASHNTDAVFATLLCEEIYILISLSTTQTGSLKVSKSVWQT